MSFYDDMFHKYEKKSSKDVQEDLERLIGQKNVELSFRGIARGALFALFALIDDETSEETKTSATHALLQIILASSLSPPTDDPELFLYRTVLVSENFMHYIEALGKKEQKNG